MEPFIKDYQLRKFKEENMGLEDIYGLPLDDVSAWTVGITTEVVHKGKNKEEYEITHYLSEGHKMCATKDKKIALAAQSVMRIILHKQQKRLVVSTRRNNDWEMTMDNYCMLTLEKLHNIRIALDIPYICLPGDSGYEPLYNDWVHSKYTRIHDTIELFKKKK
jgi:hypothetical protein